MSEGTEGTMQVKPVSIVSMFLTFFRIGATTFGGMWASAHKIEEILVHRKRWLPLSELHSLMVSALLIPAPQFIAFAGLLGFKMRGWAGSVVAVFSLILPGALTVLLGVLLIHPSLLAGPLGPLRMSLSIAVVGLLFGNAYHQLMSPKVNKKQKIIGIGIALTVFIAAFLGVPLLLSAIAGFILGALFIRNGKESAAH